MDYGFVKSQSQFMHSAYIDAPFFDSASDSSNSAYASDWILYNSDSTQFEIPRCRDNGSSVAHTPQLTFMPFEHWDTTTLTKGDGRRRKSNKSTSTEKHVPRSMEERRREQNRDSQRALRDRRAKRVSGLEHKLETLAEKHRLLLESHIRQSDEAKRLITKITETTAHIDVLKSCGGQTFEHMSSLGDFEKVDAFPDDKLYPENKYWSFDSFIPDLSYDQING